MSALPNLDLSSALAAATKVCTVEILGALEADDIAGALTREKTSPAADITTVSAESDNPKDLKKIRAKHHSVARLIASGLPQRVVANLSGYTESYLSVLLDNPAMKDLVETYTTIQGSQHSVLAERLRRVGDAAVEELEGRLDDEEKRNGMEVAELTAIAKLGLDRSGHGPQQKHHVVSENHLFDHAELRRRDRAARDASQARIVSPAALPAPALTEDNAGNEDETGNG